MEINNILIGFSPTYKPITAHLDENPVPPQNGSRSRSSSALHLRSSTKILPDYLGHLLCRGLPNVHLFPFLVAAGFESMSLSLGSGRLNRYPILTPLHPEI